MRYLRSLCITILFPLLLCGCKANTETGTPQSQSDQEVWAIDKIEDVPPLVEGLSLGMTEDEVIEALGISKKDYQITDEEKMYRKWNINNIQWRNYPGSLQLLFVPQKLSNGEEVGLIWIQVELDETLFSKEEAVEWMKDAYHLPEQNNTSRWEVYGERSFPSVPWYDAVTEEKVKEELLNIYNRVGSEQKVSEAMSDRNSFSYLEFEVSEGYPENSVIEESHKYIYLSVNGMAAAIVEREHREDSIKTKWIQIFSAVLVVVVIVIVAFIIKKKRK